jgi:chemotaxis signal transduction protein
MTTAAGGEHDPAAASTPHRPGVSAEVEAELRARRERLERRTHAERERPVAAEVIVARRGTALLGVPIEHAAEFRRAPVTLLPGVPAAVTGLFQIRGYTHCCVDLLPILTGERAPVDGQIVLIGVLHTPRGPLGLRFDEVIGPRTVHCDEIDRSLQHSSGAVVAMVTRDLLEIIDVRRLCESPDIRAAASTVDP